MRVRNLWSRPRRLTATYYAEWVLGTTRTISAAHIVPEYEAQRGALLARNPWNSEFAERVAFLTASRAPHGHGDRGDADPKYRTGRGHQRPPAPRRRPAASLSHAPSGHSPIRALNSFHARRTAPRKLRG